MAGDPNRRRRRRRLADELGAGAPDPELQALPDAQLWREYDRAHLAPEKPRDPLFGYLLDLPAEELIGDYERAMAGCTEELRAMTDEELHALRWPVELAALVDAERERRRPKPEPVIAEPPIAPHPIEMPEPTAEERRQIAAVERIVAEPDPRERWRKEQALAMQAAVDAAKIDGEREARQARALGRASPGERIGAGELVDTLHKEQGR